MTVPDSVLVQDGMDLWRRLSAVADDADGEKWADKTVRDALENARGAVEDRVAELNGGKVPLLERDEPVLVVYECDCGYKSLSAGRCRSHPYPARAMGPQLRAVEYRR